MKEFFKMKSEIYKNLYRFYKLNNDKSNIKCNEDKFINEKDFFIKIISTRMFIYIE